MPSLLTNDANAIESKGKKKTKKRQTNNKIRGQQNKTFDDATGGNFHGLQKTQLMAILFYLVIYINHLLGTKEKVISHRYLVLVSAKE